MTELNKEKILYALRCISGEFVKCSECAFYNKRQIFPECREHAGKSALALIKELTEENERLRAELRTTSDLFTASNDFLIAECARYKRYYLNHEYDKLEADVKADTVRKMQERIKAEKFHHKNFGDLVYLADIDRIAKEMEEET